MKKKYINKYVKVFTENFSYKGKKYKDFHKVIFKNAAMVIIKRKNKILITNQYRRGIKNVSFGFPGGHIKRGETPMNAAKRELFEETGLKAKSWSLLFKYINSGSYNCGYEYIFTAEIENNLNMIKLSNEIESYEWITIKNLLNKIQTKKFMPAGIIASVLYYKLFN